MRIVLPLFCFFALCAGSHLNVQGQDTSAVSSAGLDEKPAQDNPGNGPVTTDYLIGVGDALDIRVERRPELNWRGQVNSSGDIDSLPYLKKSVHVVCLNEKQAAAAIGAAYAELIKGPSITVKVIERSTQPVFLLGAIRTPQRFQLQRDVHLVELLFIAGGVTDRASGDIQIFSPVPPACKDSQAVRREESPTVSSPIRVIKILDLMAGATASNPLVGPGDIITVMAAEPVYVTGGVVSPQAINFRDQLTLARAIATVGGLTNNARGGEIRVYRRKQDLTEQDIINVDYNAIRKKKQPDVPLKAYDIIEVPQSSRSSGHRTWQSAALEIITDEKKSGVLPLRVLN